MRVMEIAASNIDPEGCARYVADSIGDRELGLRIDVKEVCEKGCEPKSYAGFRIEQSTKAEDVLSQQKQKRGRDGRMNMSPCREQ